ncbi:MAG: hypothetical protein ACREBG_29970 [Pyrinomonadaceae bacterium]
MERATSALVEDLEQLLVDIWSEAEHCDGSRAEQQAALDEIQSMIESELPDVEDRAEEQQEEEEEEEEDEAA